MNTIRSVGYGWGILIVAGGGSYYFAKRSINSDREQRAALEEQRRQTQYRLQAQEAVTRGLSSKPKRAASGSSPNADHPSPSREGIEDPAPVGHAQEEAPVGRSKYEANEPFRSRKGDRFS